LLIVALTVAMPLLMSLMMLTACGDSDDDDTPPVLTISGAWFVEGEPNHSFQFASDDDGRDAGTFAGTEAGPQGGTADVAGSWSDGLVFFTVQRGGGITYSGTFLKDDPTDLRVSSGLTLMTLVRGG
jgi:hypothetical protein